MRMQLTTNAAVNATRDCMEIEEVDMRSGTSIEERVCRALESRGFAPEEKATPMPDPGFRRLDHKLLPLNDLRRRCGRVPASVPRRPSRHVAISRDPAMVVARHRMR